MNKWQKIGLAVGMGTAVITTTHFKICPIFCEIRTYFHGISVDFMVKYVKDAF